MASAVVVRWYAAGQVGVLTLAGEIDIAAREQLDAQVGLLLDVTRTRIAAIVVDLSRLGFTDATGVNFLVRLSAGSGRHGLPVVLAASPPMLVRLLELLQVDHHFPQAPTVPQALSLALALASDAAPDPDPAIPVEAIGPLGRHR
jgi:anti-anti-sigma factor